VFDRRQRNSAPVTGAAVSDTAASRSIDSEWTTPKPIVV